jgi:lipopolysaccharide transport system ATP-binding protein
VASLLEVGTGFHQELTGRENIFLNGAILGMTKAEIKRKFDEIVAFAEIERFIDTPVKHYSSGMYVRLAFAVAAHLEPEILVVDEVLAVGDIAFQQKCMGRMGEVARGGRTILFVSHNMAAIQQLCSRAVVLDSGRVLINGPTSTAMNAYLDSIRSAQSNPLHLRTDRKGNGELRFTRVSLLSDAEEEVSSATCGESIRIRLHYKSHFHGQECSVSVAFKLTNESGVVLTTFANIQTGQPRLRVHREGFFECVWPKANIRSGTYDCTIFCAVDGETCDWIQHAFTILFEDGDFYGTGQLVSRGHGDIVCEHHWQSVEEYEKGPFHEIPFSAPRRSLS